MSAAETIAFLFKLINFGVLIGIVMYFFQRKIRAQIKTKIKEQKVFWQNLNTNKQALIDQQHKLRMEIALQKDYGNELIQKIALWQTVSTLQEQVLIEETKINAQKAYERSCVFYDKKHVRELLKQSVPLAIDNVRKTLENRFEQEKNAETFITNVINYMEKSSS